MIENGHASGSHNDLMQEDRMARTINLFAAVAALALGLTAAATPARAANVAPTYQA